MADMHIEYNRGTRLGALLETDLRDIEKGLRGLTKRLATVALMIDGDGSSADHFAVVQQAFGFDSNADAKAAYEELASLNFKLTTNSSVTDVNAALLQAFHKFG